MMAQKRNPRYARKHRDKKLGDSRSQPQRDRDRILYAVSFQRLAGVTQVIAPLEGHLFHFHNRLTHSLEVAQIARRIAERLRDTQPDLVDPFDDIDPDVAEAAALAHDLGHPPFGHIAEQELDALATAYGAPDGFEGNAQSFRIVVRSELHREKYRGLNLTRATLNAILKYPRLRNLDDQNDAAYRKFGAYQTEQQDFRWVRQGQPEGHKTIEAAIMDHADAIAYSVHDLADFYRAGMLPLHELKNRPIAVEQSEGTPAVPVQIDDPEWMDFFRHWAAADHVPLSSLITPEAVDDYANALNAFNVRGSYRGTSEQRASLAHSTSSLIHLFVCGLSLREHESGARLLVLTDHLSRKVDFFCRLVRHYVIESPRLATQQHGQRRIVRELFRIYLKAVCHRDASLVPPQFDTDLRALPAKKGNPKKPRPAETRLAVDIVASLSDNQAIAMYRRLTGAAPGSVTDQLLG